MKIEQLFRIELKLINVVDHTFNRTLNHTELSAVLTEDQARELLTDLQRSLINHRLPKPEHLRDCADFSQFAGPIDATFAGDHTQNES